MSIDELCAGYFSNSLTSEELEELKNRINTSPEDKKEFLTLREIWFSSLCASGDRRFDKNQAWQHFLAHTGKTDDTIQIIVVENGNHHQTAVNSTYSRHYEDGRQGNPDLRVIGRAERRKNPWWIGWSAAAAVAILIIVSFFMFRQGGEQTNDQFANIIIEAPLGSQSQTTLPDGTQVWLNAGSSLTYSKTFGVDGRKVILNGEGYFEVTRNEKLPFSVQTDELLISVLGTKFNIRNYAENREATVYLVEGKVSVENQINHDDYIIMEPDQKVSLDKKSGNTRLMQVSASNTIEWLNGILFFDETLLPDIAKELERNYDVTITVHPDLANLRFYGSFSRKDMSVNDILDILSSTGKMKYNRTGNEITINPK